MRRGRFLILIALLLVLSVAGIFLVIWLNGGAGPFGGGGNQPPTPEARVEITATPQPVLQIIAAGQNLERGVVIPTEALIAVPWPTSLVPPSAITDPNQIVGSRARYTLARGEPIFSTMIVESLLQLSPTGSDAAAQIPPGYVAITIPYGRNHGVGLGVKDGDHVNVIVTWSVVELDQTFQTILPNLSTVLSPPNPDGVLAIPPSVVSVVNSGNTNTPNRVGRGEAGVETSHDFYVVPSEPQRPRLVTQGIIQDALVLHVGEFAPPRPVVVEPTATVDPSVTQPPTPPATATPLPPDIITLVVSPQDAIVLNYLYRMAEKHPNGVQFAYALRSAGDTSRVDTESVTLSYMFEKFNIALPAKLNYGLDQTPLALPTSTPAPAAP